MSDFQTFLSVKQKALEYFSKGAFLNEFHKAKNEFFENSSVLDESHPSYLVRVDQFLDWYFFSRPLADFRLAPALCVFMLPDLRWEPSEEVFASLLKEVKHSLFEVIRVKNTSIVILDLFLKEKHEVEVGSQAMMYSKDTIFDGRILRRQKEVWLLKGKCFHVPDAKAFLLSEIKKYQKDLDLDRERFLLASLKMRYLAERYPQAKIDQIYSWQNRWIENEFK